MHPAPLRGSLIPQNVTGITAGILDEVLLVVVLCGIKFCGSSYLSHDRPIEFARLVPPQFYALGGLLLGFARIEDG